MLFLMFNEKYLSVAIMKSCFPDPLFFLWLGLLCYIKMSFCKNDQYFVFLQLLRLILK